MWVPIGISAALHWRMALLVRRWRMRRARKWELLELCPQEYPSDPLVARFHGAAGCLGVAPPRVLIGLEDLEGSAGWETRLGRAGREWWRRGLRFGVRAALKDLRADQAERRFEKVEAGECAGFKERWRTKAVVGARRLSSGGVMAMVEWPNQLHVNSEVRLIDLTPDERSVAHRIVFARSHAKKVARAAVKAVVTRAATACTAEREAQGQVRRRGSRLAEGVTALRGGGRRAGW